MLRITFEDHGQGFTEWVLSDAGVVIDCKPYGFWQWGATKVYNVEIQPGEKLSIKTIMGKHTTLPYPVKAVEIVGLSRQPLVPPVKRKEQLLLF